MDPWLAIQLNVWRKKKKKKLNALLPHHQFCCCGAQITHTHTLTHAHTHTHTLINSTVVLHFCLFFPFFDICFAIFFPLRPWLCREKVHPSTSCVCVCGVREVGKKTGTLSVQVFFIYLCLKKGKIIWPNE